MAASELDRLGHRVRFGLAMQAELRGVRSFIAFQDPTGNNIELMWRPATAANAITADATPGSPGSAISGYALLMRSVTDLLEPRLKQPGLLDDLVTGSR
jgi:hypothetical protein